MHAVEAVAEVEALVNTPPMRFVPAGIGPQVEVVIAAVDEHSETSCAPFCASCTTPTSPDVIVGVVVA